MRMQSRLLRFLTLFPAALLLGVSGEVAAQESHDHGVDAAEAPPATMRTLRWSDPASWPDGKVPGK